MKRILPLAFRDLLDRWKLETFDLPRQHAQDARQWGRDLARREWLDANGWRLLVLRAEDVFDDPWATARRVGEALAARGYEKELPADPPVAFATHFPGRPWKRAKV